MFAVLKAGGSQYRVSPGDVLSVAKMSAEKAVDFCQVLMVRDGDKAHVGDPFLENAVVKADVSKNIRLKKILVFKKKRRNNYRRLNGHRQDMTLVRIRDIT